MTTLFRSALRWLPVLMLGALGAAPAARATEACAALLKGQRINVVVPYKPGGGYDAYARLMAPRLESALDARVSVTNLPAGDGLAGLQAIQRGPLAAGPLVLGITSVTRLLEREHVLRASDGRTSDFVVLGYLSHSSQIWAIRRGEDLANKPGVLLASATASPVTRVYLPAMALGLKVDVVKGLSSSGDAYLALQRGDVDIIQSTENMFVRGALDLNKVQPAFFMVPSQVPELQRFKLLGGKGGWVSERSAGLPLAQQQRREAAATLAQAFGTLDYSVIMAQTAPESVRTCLARVIEGISFDSDFLAQAERQRLDPRPQRVADVQSWLKAQHKLLRDNRDLIDEALRLAQ